MLSLLAWLLAASFMVLREWLKPRGSLVTGDWYSFLQLYLFACYVFPVLAIHAGVVFPATSYVHDFPGAAETPAGAIAVLCFMLFSWAGYTAIQGSSTCPRTDIVPDKRIIVGLIVIVGASTLAWIMAYGGFVQAVTSVMMIRFGRLESETSATWFVALTKAAWVAAVIALNGLLYSRREHLRRSFVFAAQILLGISALALLLRGSRGAIGNVLIATGLMIVLRSMKNARMPDRRTIMALMGIVAVAVSVVVLFKPTMAMIRIASTDYTLAEAVENFRGDVLRGTSSSEGEVSVVGKLASEFSHFPLLTTLAIEYDQKNSHERDYGGDLLIAIGKLVPAALYEPPGVPLSYRTTELILGRWESQIPAGIIAWLVLTGGPLYLLVGSLAAGMILAVTERVTVQLLRRTWWQISGYIAFGLTTASGFVGGAPGDTFRSIGIMLITLVAATAVGRAVEFVPKRIATSPHPAGTGS